MKRLILLVALLAACLPPVFGQGSREDGLWILKKTDDAERRGMVEGDAFVFSRPVGTLPRGTWVEFGVTIENTGNKAPLHYLVESFDGGQWVSDPDFIYSDGLAEYSFRTDSSARRHPSVYLTTYRFRKEDYLLAIIRIDDFENIKHSLGRMGVDDLAERIAERICREFGTSAYYVDINCFAVIKLSANTHQLSRQIKECFNGSFNLEIGDDEIELDLEPVISFINVHGENVEGYEMTTLIQNSTDHFHDKEHVIQESDELIKPIRREKEVLRLIDNAIKQCNYFLLILSPGMLER